MPCHLHFAVSAPRLEARFTARRLCCSYDAHRSMHLQAARLRGSFTMSVQAERCDEPILDVAIIGGGPAGLAVATGLVKAAPQYSVKVFERAGVLKPKGAGLVLSVNGLKALKALSVPALEAIKELCTYPGNSITLDISGQTISTYSLADKGAREQAKYGLQTLHVGWFELQQVLLGQLPPDTVQLARAFEKYELREGHVGLHFNGTADVLKAKVVVGCDGYLSSLREQWRNDGRPIFGGAVMFRGRLPVQCTSLPTPDTAYFVAAPGKFTFLYPASKGQIVWVASIQRDVLRTLVPKKDVGDGSPELKQQCVKAFAEFPAVVLDTVKATDESCIIRHGVYYRDPESYPDAQFGTGPITLVGDAAHPLRPTGQGANMALEDAVVLAQQIRRLGVTEDALRAYEAARMQRWKKAAFHTAAAGSSAYGGSANLGVDRDSIFLDEIFAANFEL